MIGTTLGPYRVIDKLGEGGMGEVYRARDTSLNRDVAVKVLPAAVVADRERLARFQREAEALATLNHPNIAHIYGLEKHSGMPAIVMELVEGPTLAERIAAGVIPLAEALPIARQIAEALEAAHERGIIHRDLKPANIKVTDDGTVKVLDFGLAKALAPAGDSPELSNSPTLTARATEMGIVLGTAAYMAPEQARAKRVDKRADVWAFGVVLFEMLSGRRAFEGEDASETLASVLKEDPPYDALPPDLPPRVRQVIRGCLQKLPRQRIADIQDARLALDGMFDTGAESAAALAPVPARRGGWVWVAAGLAGLAVGVAGLVVGTLDSTLPAPRSPLRRYPLAMPASHGILSNAGTLVAISPNGQAVAYRANQSGVWRIFTRSLAGSEAAAVPGTGDAAANIFFSHDGEWMAFKAGLALSKVRLSGGRPVVVTSLPAGLFSGRWEADGTIWFAVAAGLMRVPAAGGEAELVLAAGDDDVFAQPDALPNGRAVLVTVRQRGNAVGRAVMAVELDTPRLRPLVADASGGWYSLTGHLLFVREQALWAVRFDPERLEVVGEPILVEQGLRVESGGAVQLAASEDGTLAYFAGAAGAGREIVLIDRQSAVEVLSLPPRAYRRPRISPDGTRLAVMASDQENDIYVVDLARPFLRRLTFNPDVDRNPIWLTSAEIVFGRSVGQSPLNVFRVPADADAATEPTAVFTSSQARNPLAVSRDGRRIVIGGISTDLYLLDLDRPGDPAPLVVSPFVEDDPALSPDDRWLAYESNESGTLEVYVRPLVGATGHRQASTSGGQDPVWSGDSRTLFYRQGDAILSVSVASGAGGPVLGRPQIVLSATGLVPDTFPNFDVSADGQRFVVVRAAGLPDGSRSEDQLVVVENLLDELQRLLPVEPTLLQRLFGRR
jgi:serine/threonine-protein kinase